MKNLSPRLIWVLFMAMAIFTGCEKTAGDELRVLEPRNNGGKNRLTVATQQANGAAVPGSYQLDLIGPFNFTYSLVISTREYTFENVPSGDYTIIVSKDGFVGMTKQISFGGNGEGNIDYVYRVNMTLTRKGNCRIVGPDGDIVPVRNLGTGGPGIGSRDGFVRFPAGAITNPRGEQICITAVAADPEALNNTLLDGTTASYMYVCETSGLQFGNPLISGWPLDFPRELAEKEFWINYKSGDIATGQFQFQFGPGNAENINFVGGGANGVAPIPHFSAWQIVGNVKIEFEEEWSDPKHYLSGCNTGMRVTYDTTGNFGPIFRAYFFIPNDSFPRVRQQFETPPQNLRAVEADMRHTIRKYSIICTATKDTLETGMYPTYPFENNWRYRFCHNSGGGG